ncbi:hypothetical protein HPB49_017422 [Dermacentor silvarum]|uniref:Uncharacterized protein n=1 Tax=Dermacentor silvarum TaxID=543639 RepID=A0ACB8CSD1_DERSI|nr:hypothetical protein HPB49_017422 [Dermacentor silvarum]
MTISPEQSALSTTASANDKGALPLRLNISGHSSQRIGCNTAMLPGSPQYTLVGFSDVLDWKPLLFVKPIPPNRVCALCGLIRPVSVLLLCGHVFCDCCSEQGVVDDDHHCPLDGGRCTKDDVEWRRFPAANLLQRDKPVESSNSEVFSKQASLSLSDLEQDGYVLDDKLQCRWDIL